MSLARANALIDDTYPATRTETWKRTSNTMFFRIYLCLREFSAHATQSDAAHLISLL